jgi:phosphate transport system substrate-binding protein
MFGNSQASAYTILARVAVAVAVAVVAALGMAAPPVWASDIPDALLPSQRAGQTARDNMVIVGDTGLTEITRALATKAVQQWGVAQPKLELEGSRTGFKKFCAGIGAKYPDIVASTRRMHRVELDQCQQQGITDIIEVPVGYSALAFVATPSATPMKLTSKHIYQAFAEQVPQDLDFVINPYKNWSQIDSRLPERPIHFIIQSENFGLRNLFDDVFLQGGCRKFTIVKLTFEAKERVKLCVTPRQDGLITQIQAGSFFEIPKILEKSPPGTVAIMPFFIADRLEKAGELQVLEVNGVSPSRHSINSDEYDGALTIYYYVKRQHMRDKNNVGVVGGLRYFIVEATSEEARGDNGFLVDLGVIPMPADERARLRRSNLRLEKYVR